jgi:signal transduction histidine kinase/ActR/RegA family two-component response regulator
MIRVASLFVGLYRRFAPSGVLNSDDPNHWKERVLYTFMLLSLFLALGFAVASSADLVRRGYWVVIATIGAISAVFLIMILRPNIDFKIRAVVSSLLVYCIGISIIYSVGPFMAPREWLFMFSLIASVLLGWPGAISSVALNLATFIVIGIILGSGQWHGATLPDEAAWLWYQTGSDLFVRSDRDAQAASALLRSEKTKLMESTAELERVVEQRQQAEDAIRKNSERERKLLDSIAAGIMVVRTSDRQIVYANSKARSLSGRQVGDLIAGICHNRVCPADIDNCPILDQGQTVDSSERELLRPDGTSIPILKTAVAINFHDEECLLETFFDITDRRKLESELSQSQKMQSIGTLAGGIAHDFNNLLTAILGYTELSIVAAEPGASYLENLSQVMQAGERAKALVQQILTFARRTDPELRPVEVGLIVREAMDLLRSSLPSTIQIEDDIASEVLVMADPTQIHQICMNICTNAAHAMDESGGVLKIALSSRDVSESAGQVWSGLKSGDYLQIEISDTGVGIPKENLNLIFEPYFTTKAPGAGTGLGMSVVHGIVHSLGGDISIRSESGAGTTITIMLPVADGESPAVSAAPEQLHLGDEHILYVDDEPAIPAFAREVLQRLGYTVTICSSSLDALELFKASPERFDAVITDMTMPNLSGERLAIEMKSLREDLPVILCTGFSSELTDRSLEEIGVNAVIQKPVGMSMLSATLRQALDAKRLADGSAGPAAQAD